MWTAAQEVDCMLRRPAREGSIGWCQFCKDNVRGVLHGEHRDNICGVHGDDLEPAREEICDE
jgi:hypothetical protein